MKHRLLFAATAILAIVSCSRNEIIEDKSQGAPDITASIINDSPNVKTSISVDQDGVGTIWWLPKDKVNIFFDNTSVPYTSTNTEPATTVVFTTTAMIGSTESASSNRWGLYPYDENASCDGRSVTTTIPSLQYAVPETFDNGSFTMLGHSSDNKMTFYNVCGGIKFSLSRDDIQKITFKGNNNEDITGKVKLKMDANGRPEATVVEGQKNIILLPKNGTTFASNTNYYIVTLPVSMTNGFTMTFETETQVGMFNYTAKAVTISRSKFGRKASIDTYATFGPSSTKNICFEDPDVKSFCVKKWDTNKDGELSYAEAAAVTNVSSSFHGNTQFDYFDEFRFFTGLHYIGNDSDDNGAFDGCTNLKSICLPEGIQYIDEYVFWNCSSLEYIEMPSTIHRIYGNAFHGCTRLNTIRILAIIPPDFDDYSAREVFNGVPTDAHVYVPTESIDSYRASKWGSYFTWIDDKLITNLSNVGTANCYIVSQGGTYKLKATKGNSDTSVGEVKGVKVLWESFGTDVTPSVGDLIKPDVSYADGYITFSTNDTYKEGNAVIAAYSDANCTEGNVLWSWHIWLTDVPEEQVYYNNAGTMMDRNLGATSATPGDVHALGLLYQWGRKDPFLCASSIISTDIAESTIAWPISVVSNATNGTIEYATAHPTTFIRGNKANEDWYYTGTNETNDDRWNNTKGQFDPCPQGWRVPDGGVDGIWFTAFGGDVPGSGHWDSSKRGKNFGSGNGMDKSFQLGGDSSIWYPVAGYYHGGLHDVGEYGYYWSCSTVSFYADFLNYSAEQVSLRRSYSREEGFSVRCQKLQ